MSMEKYEHIREEGWKLLWKNDRAFEHGEAPTAKVISFFCKRKHGEVEVCLNKDLRPVDPYAKIHFDKMCEVSWLENRLNHVLRYTKSWNDYNIYQCGVLQEYLKQCTDGGYTKCILSNQEMAMLLPKKKK